MNLHNHPQKASYASDADWPKAPSAQGHWDINGTLAHMHVDLKAPYFGEIDGPVTCEFAIVLHDFPGHVTSVECGYHTLTFAPIIWDATGTSTPPPMIGNPNGDVTFTGKFTAAYPTQLLEWWYLTVVAKAKFDNGDALLVAHLCPIWALLVPPPGIEVLQGFSPFLSSRVQVTSAAHPELRYGNTSVEYIDPVPLLPIAHDYPVRIQSYSYGGEVLVEPATTEIRADLDLHHGIPGTTLYAQTQAEDLGFQWAFVPAAVGAGQHKYAVMRMQPKNEELLAALMVTFATVGDEVPQPERSTVPNLIGLTETGAINALAAVGLVPGTISNLHNSAQAGEIFVQNPSVGALVPIGSSVAFTVSLGAVQGEWMPVTAQLERLQGEHRLRYVIGGEVFELVLL